jgi:hypothetical protein
MDCNSWTWKMHCADDQDGMAVVENRLESRKPFGIAFVDHVFAICRRRARGAERFENLTAHGIVIASNRCTRIFERTTFGSCASVHLKADAFALAGTNRRCCSTQLASSKTSGMRFQLRRNDTGQIHIPSLRAGQRTDRQGVRHSSLSAGYSLDVDLVVGQRLRPFR